MGNPEAPAGDLAYLVEYTRATCVITIPRVADALAEALRASPTLRRVLLVARRRDRRRSGGPIPRSARFAELPRPTRSANVDRRAPASDTPVATHRDDVAIWLFTSRLDRQAEGDDPHAPRLRVQHRGLREAHRRLSPRRRDRQRAASLLRLRDGHEPHVPVRGRRDHRPLHRAPDARALLRRDRALSADGRHQRADDAGQAPRARRRAARQGQAGPRSSRACASRSRPARRCPPALLHALDRALRRERRLRRHRLGRDVPHLRDEPPRRREARLARQGRRGLRAQDPLRGRRAAPARRRSRRTRSACSGSRATASRSATGTIATRAGRRSTATGAAPAISSASTRRATSTSPVAPTISSRSAASGSRRSRSRSACCSTPPSSLAAVIGVEDDGLVKTQGVRRRARGGPREPREALAERAARSTCKDAPRQAQVSARS